MPDPFANIPEEIKHLVDGASILAAIGAFMAWLPSISCILSIIWMGLRIYETDTVQGWLRAADNDE